MWTYAYVNMMLCGMCIEYFLSYDVIYAIIWVLCHANGWNLCTNTRNATMRSIENMMANKKKITIYFGSELLGYYSPGKKIYNVKKIMKRW
jgi:hypothetical protein